jgi:hypothetical protein
MRPPRALLAAGLAALVFAAVTLVALEGVEVVQLRTTAPDGSLRTTRTWVADAGGAMWIEAATPERPFLQDIGARPEAELVRGGRVLRLRATVVPGEEGHRQVRGLLRVKYGWADRWIGMLTDTSRSVAIRLEPAAIGATAAPTPRGRWSSARSVGPAPIPSPWWSRAPPAAAACRWAGR